MARRIVRPLPPTPARPLPCRHGKLQSRLEAARRGFQRWLSKLKRACRAVEKQQSQIARLEK